MKQPHWAGSLLKQGIILILLVVCLMSMGEVVLEEPERHKPHIARTTLTAAPTPSPTPTPLPDGTGNHMSLGNAYHNDPTNGFTITHSNGTFSAKDQMAFVVSLDHPLNTVHLTFALLKVYTDNSSFRVLTAPFTISAPTSTQLANQFPICDLMGLDPPGRYRLQIENGSTIVAHADFTYTG
jgi:hypothetical protein